MTPEVDAVIVGAGIVGLAAAAALGRSGRSTIVVERNEGVARECSARNSEVIHAGIYYPEGSNKARMCVAGRSALYERCERLGIPHRRIGKIVVAADPAEVSALEELERRGRANGVSDLGLLDSREVSAREPAIRAVAALDSPSSGIVDAGALALSYAAEAERYGAAILLRSEVCAIDFDRGAYRVQVRGPDAERSAVIARAVVNAAGLASDRVAALAGFDPDALGYTLHPCKGDYFSLSPGARVRLGRLVYPVPSGPGLGIHATLDLAGRIRFGPDAEYVDRLAYDVDPAKAVTFAAAIERYLPGFEAAWLQPEMSGIRPRLAAPGEAFRDFVVREESDRGRPGFVNLIGIESPGLTAAPAIAERVASLLASV